MMTYSFVYAFMTLGAFGVVSVVQQQTGGDSLSHFAGLNRKANVHEREMVAKSLGEGNDLKHGRTPG